MDGLTTDDWHALLGETERVFAENEVDGGSYYFHMPSADFYPSLFAWDSGFQSVAMLHVDPGKAKRELETLFGQVSADGHMPHEVLIRNEATTRQQSRNILRWFARWQYDSKRASRLIDPPVYVYSALLTYERTGDEEWLTRIWPNLRRYVDYLLDTRDLLGDGLLSILHPWESGTDLSPQFFEIMGVDPGSTGGRLRASVYPPWLYVFNNRRRWNPEVLRSENRFVVEDLTFNCITVRAVDSAAKLASVLGDERRAGRYRSRAALMAQALDDICWDEDSGCYYPRWDASSPRLSPVKTAASLLPLFTGQCDTGRCERLVREHLLNQDQFWTRYLLPFNPSDELSGERPWVDKKLWAGHCIWTNFSWMVALGLGEYGMRSQARELTRRTVKMIEAEGFYEFYDSRTGQGRRVHGFTWPGLALDMMARFWPEALP